MKKAYLSMFTVATLFGFLFLLSHWKLKAQESGPLQQTQQAETEEFIPNLDQESDVEFVQSMDLLEDSDLMEMLISDPDFLDVLEEFGEDIGIEEEEIPYELLEENEIFSKLMSEAEKSGKAMEMARVSVCSLMKKEGR